jgi:hypothetical protein
LGETLSPQHGSFSQRAWPTAIVLAVALIYLAAILIPAGGDPMATVLLGTRYSQHDPTGTEGYDGQFAYQIARSPLQAAPYLDVSAYRYQRILYPLLAHLLALGQPGLVPWTLILINLAALGLGTWATERILARLGVNPWYALGCGLFGGLMLGLRADLNEPLAQALVQVAILAWMRQRKGWAILGFGLAALTKETTLIFLAAFLLSSLLQRSWRWVAALAAGALPFVLYQLVLWQWLGSPGLGSGGAGATSFSILPLGGWLAIANMSWQGFLLISLVVVPMAIIPSLVGIWLSTRRLLTEMGHPLVWSLLLNSAIILFLPTSTFREPVAMMRLSVGLVSSMLLFGGLVKSRRILLYSQLWVLTNVLLLKGTGG